MQLDAEPPVFKIVSKFQASRNLFSMVGIQGRATNLLATIEFTVDATVMIIGKLTTNDCRVVLVR